MGEMLTADERLALLAAVDKKVGPALKEAKAEACAQLMERCAEDGTDRRAVTVGGEKVGTVGVSYAKARPVILDAPAAIECLRGMGLTEEVPAKGWEDAFTAVAGTVVAKDTGEAVDWAAWEPERPKGASVRIGEPQKVLDAFGARLSDGGPLALLEGGAE